MDYSGEFEAYKDIRCRPQPTSRERRRESFEWKGTGGYVKSLLKWDIARTVAMISLFLIATMPAHAQQCSTEGVAGDYGFTIAGTLLSPTGAVLVAGVGKASLSANGGFSGTEARSVGGGFANETLNGTFTVNSDCTGTLTAQVFDDHGKLVRTSVFSIVFDNDEKEIRAVQESLQLPNGTFVPAVITVEGKKTLSGDQQN